MKNDKIIKIILFSTLSVTLRGTNRGVHAHFHAG